MPWFLKHKTSRSRLKQKKRNVPTYIIYIYIYVVENQTRTACTSHRIPCAILNLDQSKYTVRTENH